MINSFIKSFKIQNAYRTNSIIYSIKQLPFIKKVLPNELYQNTGIKLFASIISGLIEFIKIFLGKFIYILFMIILPMLLYKNAGSNLFIHFFTFLTIVGGFVNTELFNPSNDKYYAIILMKFNARKYALCNYYYFLLKIIVGFMPFVIFFGLSENVPLYICLLLPIFVVMVKLIAGYFIVLSYKDNKNGINENKLNKNLWILIAIILIAVYLLPYIGIVINELVFIILFIISVTFGLFSLYKIHNYQNYLMIYKIILDNHASTRKEKKDLIGETYNKTITMDNTFKSNKHGYAFFHELFVKRHSKILTNAIKKQMISIAVILVIAIVAVLLNREAAQKINGVLLTYLPYFVFVMYILNRGMVLTEAMFINCDHAMLTYRFYRTPKVILGIFKERLKTLILINIIPALMIACGLVVLLYLTGGTSNYLNYVFLFVSIIAMSIFFSVHYLVLYYLLQPYNVNTEMKSSTYSLAKSLTYFVCYVMMQCNFPTIIFGSVVSAFCIIYSIVSLFIAYRYAPKTFKLRI